MKLMTFITSRLLITAAFLLLLTAPVQAQTDHEKNVVSLQLGNKVVRIPSPAGYTEVTAEFENLKARFAATEPPQNELLLGYVPTSDYDLMKGGKEAVFEYYAKVAVVRMTKERTISREEFTAVVNYIHGNDAKILDEKSPMIQNLFKQFDKQISKEYSKDVKTKPTETTILGAFDQRPNLYSSMMLMTINREVDGKITTLPVLGTLNVLHVNDRMISVATYRGYHSKDDIAALKTFSTNWMNGILAAN